MQRAFINFGELENHKETTNNAKFINPVTKTVRR